MPCTARFTVRKFPDHQVINEMLLEISNELFFFNGRKVKKPPVELDMYIVNYLPRTGDFKIV